MKEVKLFGTITAKLARKVSILLNDESFGTISFGLDNVRLEFVPVPGKIILYM